MGPKKKGGGKKKEGGGGKKSASKKKDSPGETITFNEAVRTYQLDVKQMHLNSLKEDVSELKEKNQRQKQRNLYLRKEQQGNIKEVMDQAQEFEQKINESEKVPFEDVESALKEKLCAINIEENHVEDLKEKIESLDKEIEVQADQLEKIKDYKGHGQYIDKTHIEVLLKEMEDMENSYTEMASFFDKSLLTMKQTITKQNDENMALQKNQASEEVIKNLDKQTEQEFMDNDWLSKEVAIHRNHIVGAEFEIKMLEKQNIETMSYLFEQQVDDVKQTKKFYLSCKSKEERESFLLLTNGEEEGADDEDGEEDDDEDGDGDYDEENADGEEIIQTHGNVSEDQEMPDDLKWLDQYLHEFDCTSSTNDFKLGPVEVKLLCVVGTQVPLHDISKMSAEGLLFASKSDPHYKWIVEREELRRRASYEQVL